MNKKTLSTIAVILSLSSGAIAESRLPEPMTCVPTRSLHNPAQASLKPKAVEDLLVQLRRDLSEDELNKMLGEPVLRSLDSYSKVDPRGINANYAAAVAAGAAVAVVDYVWDKYVGNARNRLVAPPDYFDSQRFPNIPSFEGKVPSYNPQLPKPVTNNPYAMTPAVAVATAGAVAYKAAEYSLRKAFGDPKNAGIPENFDTKQFDLSSSRN